MNEPATDRPDRPGTSSGEHAEPPSSAPEPPEHDVTGEDGGKTNAVEDERKRRTPRGGYQPL